MSTETRERYLELVTEDNRHPEDGYISIAFDLLVKTAGGPHELVELYEDVQEKLARRGHLSVLPLPIPKSGVIPNISMEFDASTIIEQAAAENVRHVAPVPDHPAPDTVTELGSIATTAAELHKLLSAIHERVPDLTVTEVATAIEGLRRITTASDRTAWQLGLHAVEQGLISQTKLAELLGSSSPTVSRRFREGQDAAEP